MAVYYDYPWIIDVAKQKPKDKGTKAESDVVGWARKHEFFDADRLTLKGATDRGDVRLCRGVMVQVKDGYTNGKEPSDFLIGEWLKETEKQRKTGEWEVSLLVHKRFGKGDPDDWRWYVDGWNLTRLGCAMPYFPPYIQLQGYMIPPLLRNAGYRA